MHLYESSSSLFWGRFLDGIYSIFLHRFHLLTENFGTNIIISDILEYFGIKIQNMGWLNITISKYYTIPVSPYGLNNNRDFSRGL